MQHSTCNPQPSTLNPQPLTLSTQPPNLNPQPSTLNPQHLAHYNTQHTAPNPSTLQTLYPQTLKPSNPQTPDNPRTPQTLNPGQRRAGQHTCDSSRLWAHHITSSCYRPIGRTLTCELTPGLSVYVCTQGGVPSARPSRGVGGQFWGHAVNEKIKKNMVPFPELQCHPCAGAMLIFVPPSGV